MIARQCIMIYIRNKSTCIYILKIDYTFFFIFFGNWLPLLIYRLKALRSSRKIVDFFQINVTNLIVFFINIC